VNAQQCVQLSGTNRSFGLIALARSSKRRKRPIQMPQTKWAHAKSQGRKPNQTTQRPKTKPSCFDGLVAIARGNTPDPIPNSAVKTLSANGTSS
jgi:hypothetical protein